MKAGRREGGINDARSFPPSRLHVNPLLGSFLLLRLRSAQQFRQRCHDLGHRVGDAVRRKTPRYGARSQPKGGDGRFVERSTFALR
jgi:hypothetical protein